MERGDLLSDGDIRGREGGKEVDKKTRQKEGRNSS